MIINYNIIPSPLWELFILADEDNLLLLEFYNSIELEDKKKKIQSINTWELRKWLNTIIMQTQDELDEYFFWKRKIFTIPILFRGTEFQMKAWQALQKIPYWETRSYFDEASMIGNPKAVRAIGWANHNNPIVIIIPCHRVIGKSGEIVWYGWGIDRKIWLLAHEKSNL